MAFNILSKSFRLLNIFRTEISYTHYSTQRIISKNFHPILLHDEKSLPKVLNNYIFNLNSVDLQFPTQRNRIPLSKIIEYPKISNTRINDPFKNNFEEIDIVPNKIIEIPPNTNINKKEAVRLIVIRRKKIKKHKRRKYLKKMFKIFEKRKIRKREQKERQFNAELNTITLKAEMFDAKKYVAERIELLTRCRLPNKWRGENLPKDRLKQFIEEKEKKREYKRRLHMYRLKVE